MCLGTLGGGCAEYNPKAGKDAVNITWNTLNSVCLFESAGKSAAMHEDMPIVVYAVNQRWPEGPALRGPLGGGRFRLFNLPLQEESFVIKLKKLKKY